VSNISLAVLVYHALSQVASGITNSSKVEGEKNRAHNKAYGNLIWGSHYKNDIHKCPMEGYQKGRFYKALNYEGVIITSIQEMQR